MINELSGLTGDVLKLALNASWLRHQVIADNIANSNSPGFIPNKVDFESQFSDALKRSHNMAGTQADKTSLESVKAEVVSVDEQFSVGDTKVYLEKEMVNMAKNTTHYKALLSGMAKRGALIGMAISGGKG